MSGVFVSYRRDDSQGFAGRLTDDLDRLLGEDRVFRDIEIPIGSDFGAGRDLVGFRLFGDESIQGNLHAFDVRLEAAWERLLRYFQRLVEVAMAGFIGQR